MRPTRSPWLVTVPIALGGCLAAHWLAYVVTVPEAAARHGYLDATGHAYLDPLEPAAIVALVVLAAALFRRALSAASGQAAAAPRPLHFALLGPVAFTVQEHFERVAHTHAFPLALAGDRTFLVGLLLQLPVAALALLLARALLRAAVWIGTRLRPPVRRPVSITGTPLVRTDVVRPALLSARGQRAPPAPSVT